MSEIIKIEEIKPLEKKASKAVAIAENLVVKTDEDEKKATVILSSINKGGDEIKKKKEEITKPLNSALKSARELFKPLEADVKTATDIIKRKMIEYRTIVEEKKKKTEDAIAARVEKGTMKVETAVKKMGEIEKPEKNVSTDTGAVNYRMVKEVTVTDETKVPREYLMLNMPMINKAAKAGVKIEGVEVKEVKTIANYR